MIRSFSSNQVKLVKRSFSSTRYLLNSTNNLVEEWKKLAEKQLKGKSPDNLKSQTAEVIPNGIFLIKSFMTLFNN